MWFRNSCVTAAFHLDQLIEGYLELTLSARNHSYAYQYLNLFCL